MSSWGQIIKFLKDLIDVVKEAVGAMEVVRKADWRHVMIICDAAFFLHKHAAEWILQLLNYPWILTVLVMIVGVLSSIYLLRQKTTADVAAAPPSVAAAPPAVAAAPSSVAAAPPAVAATPPAANFVKIGTFGGGNNPGNYFDVWPVARLLRIFISFGNIIDGIQIEYMKEDGTTVRTDHFGGHGGGHDEVSLSEGENIVLVSGVYGEYCGSIRVSSLLFITNRGRTLGAYGTANQGTAFAVPVLDGGRITSFFGISGRYLDGIGFYVTAA